MPRPSRLFLAALGIALALLAGRALVRSFASEETRIRGLVQRMARGFDRGRPGPAVAGLAPEWRDGESDVDRELLRALLLRFFFEERDQATGALRFRVELPVEELAVALDPERDGAARLRCVARFLERHEGEERLAWELAIDARLERREGEWLIVETGRTTRAGRRPGRASSGR